MASMGESSYFPPLERCFSGEHQLLSWKTCLVGLSQLEGASGNLSLRQHLTDSHTIELLKQPFVPFPNATTQSRASFETKTSAVNVTPSTDGHYDIKQIRDDTSWLSKETSIDEISALRIVALEWQSRPVAQLLQGCSGGVTNAQQDVFEGSVLRISQITSNSPFANGSMASSQGEESARFNSVDARRSRILEIYLTERRYILRVCGCILEKSLRNVESRNNSNHPAESGWIADVGNSILAAWDLESATGWCGKSFIIETIGALQDRTDHLEEGSNWFKDEPREDFEAAWRINQIVEMIHIMQILQICIGTSTTFIRADEVLAWFRYMKKCNFMEYLEPSIEDRWHAYAFSLQSLTTLTSVAMLKLPYTIGRLSQMLIQGGQGEVNRDGEFFLLNTATINEITDIITEAAAICLSNASLAVLGWAVVLQTLRELALAVKERRETGLSQHVLDNYDVANPLEHGGNDRTLARWDSSPSGILRSSSSSEALQITSVFEEILEKVMNTSLDEDPISYLAKSAVDGSNVFDRITGLSKDFCTQFGSDKNGADGLRMRLILLDLLRITWDFVDYLPELVEATLAVLDGSERYWERLKRSSRSKEIEPAVAFSKDSFLMQKIFQTALSRFPYEPLPFLQMSHILAATCGTAEDQDCPTFVSRLTSLATFTQQLPIGFESYEIVQDDDDINHIQLTDDLDLFQQQSLRQLQGPQLNGQINYRSILDRGPASNLILPRGTKGRVLSESKPLVVMWQYNYSVLTYVGKLLQYFSIDQRLHIDPAQRSTSKDLAVEIIGLLISLVMSLSRDFDPRNSSSTARDAARAILEEASSSLDRNQDIISVFFEVFEEELHQRHSGSEDAGSLDLLTLCIQFTHALLRVLPGRVWPFLGRSSLLGLNGKESKLAAVVTSHEMILGRYSFLIGCTKLFHACIEDSVVRAPQSRGPQRSSQRFNNGDTIGVGISDKATKKILLAFERTMIDVFVSSINWKFVVPDERFEINSTICFSLSSILHYVYDADDDVEASGKLTGNLAPSVDSVIETFLSHSSNELPVIPLLSIIVEGTSISSATLAPRTLTLWIAQVQAALDLSTCLLQVNKLLSRPSSRLEQQLFKVAPSLATLYASHEAFRLPVVNLFEALVRNASTANSQPPSLLGYFSSSMATDFLEILSLLDKPLNDDELAIGIWNFLSAVVSNRQRWFAIFLLTGVTPRESLKSEGKKLSVSSQRARPMLQAAMDSLADIRSLEPTQATAMLEFLALAANHWPWVVTEIQAHPNFLTAVVNYMSFLQSTVSKAGPKAQLLDYNLTQTSSFIAEIFAVVVHRLNQTGDSSFAWKILPLEPHFTQQAVSLSSYNISLHSNLSRNFESRFPGCRISNFKRTTVRRSYFGKSYYYDAELAERILCHHPAWLGKSGQGFVDEFARANVNLSTVESQVNLFRSWKSLAIELSITGTLDANSQRYFASIVQECLRSIANSRLPEAIFDRLAHSRADLAFALMQRLIVVKSAEPQIKAILVMAWDTVHTYGTSFSLSIASDDSGCYRTLLRILLLALQAHIFSPSTSSQSPPESTSDVITAVLEILNLIVAHGFRSLTSNLHDDPSLAIPDDYSLLSAILRTALRIPGIEKHNSQILAHFADNNTARCASTLFSWSDQLAIDRDPIYGELSLSFLLEMSCIPLLAEHLAVEGVLALLSTANLLHHFLRSSGTGPFDEPTRMYAIWSRGILPLCLNLLDAVGAPLASEIALFLNQFPNQLARASAAFENKPSVITTSATSGYITLSMTSEAQSLALIATILDKFRAAGPSAGVISSEIADLAWDSVRVKEGVESCLQSRSALRDRIMPTNEKEGQWVRQQARDAKSGAKNLLEEKIVREFMAVLLCLSIERD